MFRNELKLKLSVIRQLISLWKTPRLFFFSCQASSYVNISVSLHTSHSFEVLDIPSFLYASHFIMHSTMIKSFLLALATASTVVAQIAGFDAFTEPATAGVSIPAGSTYNIKWTPSSPAGQISIILLEGTSNTTLQLGPTIASKLRA